MLGSDTTLYTVRTVGVERFPVACIRLLRIADECGITRHPPTASRVLLLSLQYTRITHDDRGSTRSLSTHSLTHIHEERTLPHVTRKVPPDGEWTSPRRSTDSGERVHRTVPDPAWRHHRTHSPQMFSRIMANLVSLSARRTTQRLFHLSARHLALHDCTFRSRALQRRPGAMLFATAEKASARLPTLAAR